MDCRINACVDKWKQDMSIVRGLDSLEIMEMYQGDTLRALKLHCVLGGEAFETIGLCAP